MRRKRTFCRQEGSIMLVDTGCLTLKEQYIDGTKVESRANRYTFAWRKSVEKNRAKPELKIRCILREIEAGIASDSSPDDGPPPPVSPEDLRERITRINRENRTKKQQQKITETEDKHLPGPEEYARELVQCGERNSYTKKTAGNGSKTQRFLWITVSVEIKVNAT